MLNKVISFWLE